MASYADYTYNSKNRLKRFSHRKRFKNSVQSIEINDGIRVLDFGCGDGLFLNQLKAISSEKEILLTGYEPYLEAISDNSVSIKKDWNDILKIAQGGLFDYITCFEVLEHFSEKMQIETIEKIISVLSDNGLFIVSVPIEKSFPSVIKNVIRRLGTKKGSFNYLMQLFVFQI